MEQYHRISHTVFSNEASGARERDAILNRVLNEKIAQWAEGMKSTYPKFRYRMLNGTETDLWARTGKTNDSPLTATIHMAYEVE